MCTMLRRVAFRRLLLRPSCHRVSLKARSTDNSVVNTPLSQLSMDTQISESPWTINSSKSVSVAKPIRQSEYFRSLRYSICAEFPPFRAPPQRYTIHELYNLLAATLPLYVSADNPLFPTMATYPLKKRNSGPHSERRREAVTKF